jgi:large subunit ribosomal protein L22
MEKKETKQINIPGTASASLRYLRIAPRKTRLVVNVIKKLPIGEAEAQLMLHPRRPAVAVLKLLRSAIANAKSKKLDVSKLFISDARVDQAPILKRWMPRAQGRATPIHKQTSHVIIVLKEGVKSVQSRFITEVKKVKKPKKEAARKHEHEHEHEPAAEEKANPKTEKKEAKKETKTAGKGFVQRIFRRKSI